MKVKRIDRTAKLFNKLKNSLQVNMHLFFSDEKKILRSNGELREQLLAYCPGKMRREWRKPNTQSTSKYLEWSVVMVTHKEDE